MIEASVAMPSSTSSLRSRYLAIGDLPSEVSLAFKPMHELTLGSKRRAKEERQCLLSLLKRRRVKSWKEGEEVRASFPPHAAGKLPELLSEIDATLDAFRKQRLHPLVVEEILWITASERRRWMKDGRLPQSGMGSFGCGRQRSISPSIRPQRSRNWHGNQQRSKPGARKTSNGLLAKIQHDMRESIQISGDRTMATERTICKRCGSEFDCLPSREAVCWCAKEAFHLPMPLLPDACPSCLRLAARAFVAAAPAPRISSILEG
jgi:hypothetical protein